MIGTFFLAFSLFSSPKAQEKMKNDLHNTAEAFFSSQDYKAAKEAYLDLLEKVENDNLDWNTYADIVLRTAETRIVLEEYKEGEQLLLSLLKKNPPNELLPRITIVLARIYSLQKEAGQGYLIMKKASEFIPFEKWRPEEKMYFHAVEYALNDFYEKQMQMAKHFFVVNSFKEAIDSYEIILKGIEKGYFPEAESNFIIKKKVLFRLAESHFQLANYDKTLSLAENFSDVSQEIDTEMMFLRASAYKEKREFEKALLLFQEYMSSKDKQHLFHYEAALFEIGYYYYKIKNYECAKIYFQSLLDNAENSFSRTIAVGAIYLGKIHLEEKNINLALELFSYAEKLIEPTDTLSSEICYLKGESYFFRRNFKEASQFFEKSLQNCGDWSKSSLFKLALCYKSFGQIQNDPKYLDQAEKILKKFGSSNAEPIDLALAEIYLLQNDLKKMEAVLDKSTPHLSEEGLIEARLLRIRSEKDYHVKEQQYAAILEDKNNPLKSFAKCWYYRGLNHLQTGISSHEDDTLKMAIQCFNEAFSLLEKVDRRAADECLHLGIKISSLVNDIPLSLKFLEKLGSQEEKLYLQGMLYSQMEGKQSAEEAMNAFHALLSQFPHTIFADRALYAIASLHFKRGHWKEAEKHFIYLADQFPLSKQAVDAYFWAAEAAEKGQESKEKILFLRKQCFEKTPFSSKAATAYFKSYNFDDYLKGDEHALAHIRPFADLYPDSPYVSIAYFCQSLYEESPSNAKALLEKARAKFEENKMTIQIRDPAFFYFQCKTGLEIAKRDMATSADLSFALNTLLSLIEEFQKNDKLLKETYFSTLYEESHFTLFQLYTQQTLENKGEEILSSLLKYYNDAGIREGYYLAKTWKEQGNFAFKKNDIKTALYCYEIAEDCGKKHLSDEERLTLKILMSDCFRATKEFDRAMRTLSHVINEESNSELRFKAMFLRAEIYELQGRKELAVKQLEALSRCEGAWSQEALEKLKRSYGIW